MKRISLKDLSAELKVSKATISLVLNNKGDKHGISKATQARVKAKAEEMCYFPNQFARGLRSGQSKTIGLVVADIANPFYATMARYIEDEAAKLEYNLIICSSDEKDEKEMKLLHMLRDRRVDGLIISSTLRKPTKLLELKKLKYPIVLIDREIPKLDVPSVVVNNFKGAYEMTRHLIGMNHKKIAYLSISPNYLSTIRDRIKGYRAAMHDAGIKVNSSWIVHIPFDDVKNSVNDLLPSLLRQSEKFTALFTANNNLAVAALETLNSLGLKIPNDIAMCSFDDIDLFRIINPAITACAQPGKQIAEQSVRLLQSIIEDNGNPALQNLVLDTTLNIRESTMP